MIEKLERCEICPHRCKVDRTNNQIGRCKSKDTVKIAKFSIHKFEEPCISGKMAQEQYFFQIVTCLVNFAKTMK